MVSKEYRSWYFGDRSFLFAVAVSVLWHLFWFFSITIDVNQRGMKHRKIAEIVSLGPVLDDAIFKTLVESRAEFSKTFYRKPQEFVRETEVPQETPERYTPGDVVSMPAHKALTGTLRDRVGGNKSAVMIEDYYEIAGDVERDQLLSRPEEPPIETRKLGLKQAEFQIFIDPSGKISNVKLLSTCGDAAADHAWEQSLYEWVFRPSTLKASGEGVLSAKVVLKPVLEGSQDV